MYPKTYFATPRVVAAGSCFVLMPFAAEMRSVYETIRRAFEAATVGFTCGRADELFGGGHIIEDILEGIAQAEIVVADVTGRNPNVFYELGIAHTAKPVEKVIIITQSMDDVPFDLRQFRCIVYSNTEEGLEHLNAQLAASATTEGEFRLVVQDGGISSFPRRLLGEDHYLYDFDVKAYVGHGAAKLEIDVRRHGMTRQNEPVASEPHGLALGQSVEIPYLPWRLRLDRTAEGKAYFTVIPTEQPA